MSFDVAERLKYKSATHDKIVKAIVARYEMSQRAMASRYPAWTRADEDFQGYTPESTDDSRRKSERSSGNLQYTTLTIPMTYAIALTAHTYWSAVFFNRNPVFQLGIRKGTVEAGVQPMEALLDYQYNIGGLRAPLMRWLMDPARYGFGVFRTYWTRESKNIAQLVEVSEIDPDTGIAIPDRTRTEKRVVQLPGYRGNKGYNVRPYNFFPDTRVPLADWQKGKFCGEVAYPAIQDITKEGGYFNIDALKDVRGRRDAATRDEEVGSDQQQLPDISATIEADEKLDDKGAYHSLEMVIDVIPKDWGLGDETAPEKWRFEVGEKKVIINAEPFGYIHDDFPYDLIFYEVDGYVLDIRGMMEIGKDLNSTASWLLNSHMFNVRKALNDQLIYDPSRIVAKDMLDGGPGKMIRVKPNAYGSNIRDMVYQLPVQDVTRQHIGETQLVSELMQRILGVNDNVMGSLDPGGRKTATEVRTASTFSISRLKTIAEYFSATGFSPLTQKLVQNTQQFYFLEASEQNPPTEVFRIVGDMVDAMESIEITPEAISGFFDFVPVDGTLPIDRLAQANLLKEVVQVLAGVGGYDLDGLVNWIAKLSGVQGLQRFKLQVAPDQVVQEQAKRGNLVPNNQRGQR